MARELVLRQITIGNPDLKWERTLSTNIGVDFTAFHGRIDLSADYYIKNTDNLLLDITKAPSVGVTTSRETLVRCRTQDLSSVCAPSQFRIKTGSGRSV